MKTSHFLFRTVFLLSTALSLAIWSGGAVADDAKQGESKSAKPATATPPNMEEMTKKMQEFATPGPAHKALDALAGEWNVEARYSMGGPGTPPTTSKGVAVTRWILGGRYLQEEFSGEMMGRPFKGIGVTGYDNFKKKYISTWVDDMGPVFS